MINRRRPLVLLTPSVVVTVMDVGGAFISNNNIVHLRYTERGGRSNGRDRDVLPLRNRNSNHDDDSRSTSIGDITQNLHGGKYQFSETQYLAGGSLMGQQFAESLYSSSCDDEVSGVEEDFEIPKWALKLQQPDEHEGKQRTSALTFTDSEKSHTISITNDERSWEQYFAYVLSSTVEQSFQISPLRGHLAPRGGASNACDASKPYSDSAHITIELSGNDHADIVGEEVLLVVGTEAEVWRFELNIE